jgi:hypothetical protein
MKGDCFAVWISCVTIGWGSSILIWRVVSFYSSPKRGASEFSANKESSLSRTLGMVNKKKNSQIELQLVFNLYCALKATISDL